MAGAYLIDRLKELEIGQVLALSEISVSRFWTCLRQFRISPRWVAAMSWMQAHAGNGYARVRGAGAVIEACGMVGLCAPPVSPALTRSRR